MLHFIIILFKYFSKEIFNEKISSFQAPHQGCGSAVIFEDLETQVWRSNKKSYSVIVHATTHIQDMLNELSMLASILYIHVCTHLHIYVCKSYICNDYNDRKRVQMFVRGNMETVGGKIRKEGVIWLYFN